MTKISVTRFDMLSRKLTIFFIRKS